MTRNPSSHRSQSSRSSQEIANIESVIPHFYNKENNMLNDRRVWRKTSGCWKHGLTLLESFKTASGWRNKEKNSFKANSAGINNFVKLKDTTIISKPETSNNKEATIAQIDLTNYDFRNAFSFWSTGEIFRSYLVFTLCSYPSLVNNSMKVS
ncbi:hypothetical protein CHS0354_032990 [Potamilus streckersoni]|uniref:Uncharacterized protein n=1 Tax=Potamilus streckersoni TaxID=2493646 RepID=A0AAE0RX43_9BIVA|nr:hypothetical protein CHS0354_032990 [Potamilus streckersoni]